MNHLVSAIILAIIQGITEWIPVSSSGHLVLAERILGFKQSLVFDVALHFGTLMSVFVYFGKDITDIIQDLFKGKWKTENSKLGFLIIIATIPAAIAGFFLKNSAGKIFSSLLTLALGFSVTGLLLIIASLDLKRKNTKLSSKSAFVIGIAQIFSLLPGVSRSGTTISAGLLLGLKEKTAMKFSFLMSIPIIFGANLLVIGNNHLPSETIWATLVSFLVGLLAIHVLYKYVLSSKKNLMWFGIDALILAAIIAIYVVL